LAGCAWCSAVLCGICPKFRGNWGLEGGSGMVDAGFCYGWLEIRRGRNSRGGTKRQAHSGSLHISPLLLLRHCASSLVTYPLTPTGQEDIKREMDSDHPACQNIYYATRRAKIRTAKIKGPPPQFNIDMRRRHGAQYKTRAERSQQIFPGHHLPKIMAVLLRTRHTISMVGVLDLWKEGKSCVISVRRQK